MRSLFQSTPVARRAARWLPALVLLAAAIVLAIAAWQVFGRATTPAPAATRPDGWPASAPEAQGWDSSRLAEGLQAIQENGTAIHSLMIVIRGTVILDTYFYPYDGSTYHDLGSVTKSVMTTLIGIAADQGKLDLDAPVVSFFPGRNIANNDERKARMTLRHLASNTSGLDCDPTQGEITQQQMRQSGDWVQFVLDRQMLFEPGTHFAYCSPGLHLLSAILKQATGLSALDFARANLFGPLGIEAVDWPYDAAGNNHGWGDLSLYPSDAARIGQLFLQQGEWQGRQIVSREWVAQATRPQATTPPAQGEDYGYGWWLSRPGAEYEYFNADGRRGQKIVVVPALEAVFVMTAGGASWDEVDDYLAAAIGGDGRLPANPAGLARLQALVTSLAQAPAPGPVKPLPAIGQAAAGQRYTFADGSLVRGLQVEFAGSEATVVLDLATERAPRVFGVGLDGNYRASRSGRASLARGGWADDQTFVIEYSEGPGLNILLFRLRFEGNRVSFEVRGEGIALTLDGTAQPAMEDETGSTGAWAAR
jgi:CubicO group peptidase (beta-lactamase class C family)